MCYQGIQFFVAFVNVSLSSRAFVSFNSRDTREPTDKELRTMYHKGAYAAQKGTACYIAMTHENADKDPLLTLEDHELVRRVQNGETDLFGHLYERYVGKIYSFIYYRTQDRPTAEDLSSVIFIKALEHIGSFNVKKASFSTWVYRIAQNTLIDHYRTHKETQNIDLVANLRTQENIPLGAEVKDRLKKVQAFLETLTPFQRDVVLLRVWDDLPFKDIARITGKNESTCKVTFSRAVAKVRKEFPLALLLLLLIKL